MKLTNRQKATYELIEKNSRLGKDTDQYEIYSNYSIREHADGYKWNDNKYCHDNCPTIWSDIQAINFSPEVEKIIIIDNFRYKLAETHLEALKFAKRYKEQGIAKFSRYGAVLNKIKANGKGEFTEVESELHFVESFLK